ncbi:MAG TPA: DUF1127 domain-containing protein [Xanthobacteraceae bacterium]|jgi:uncharacterized protein YjiS (DUF1127 family)
MTTISRDLPARQGMPGQLWGRGLVATLKRWWTSYTTWRVEQAAISELWGMGDRELRDIGLTRSEIESAVKSEAVRNLSECSWSHLVGFV